MEFLEYHKCRSGKLSALQAKQREYQGIENVSFLVVILLKRQSELQSPLNLEMELID